MDRKYIGYIVLTAVYDYVQSILNSNSMQSSLNSANLLETVGPVDVSAEDSNPTDVELVNLEDTDNTVSADSPRLS